MRPLRVLLVGAIWCVPLAGCSASSPESIAPATAYATPPPSMVRSPSPTATARPTARPTLDPSVDIARARKNAEKIRDYMNLISDAQSSFLSASTWLALTKQYWKGLWSIESTDRPWVAGSKLPPGAKAAYGNARVSVPFLKAFYTAKGWSADGKELALLAGLVAVVPDVNAALIELR